MFLFSNKNNKIVFVTSPLKEAYGIGEKIVTEKLAACANITQKIDSIYWWQGKIEKEAESLIIFKTTKNKIKKLITRIKEIHPYKVPEIIAVDISSGNKEYLDWIKDSVTE